MVEDEEEEEDMAGEEESARENGWIWRGRKRVRSMSRGPVLGTVDCDWVVYVCMRLLMRDVNQ